MDHVVVNARMIRRTNQQIAQYGHRFHAGGARRLRRQFESAHEVQGEIGAGFNLIGILRDNRAQALDIGFLGIFAFPSRRARMDAMYSFSSGVAFPGTCASSFALRAASIARVLPFSGLRFPNNTSYVSSWKRGRQSPAATIAIPQ